MRTQIVTRFSNTISALSNFLLMNTIVTSKKKVKTQGQLVSNGKHLTRTRDDWYMNGSPFFRKEKQCVSMASLRTSSNYVPRGSCHVTIMIDAYCCNETLLRSNCRLLQLNYRIHILSRCYT